MVSRFRFLVMPRYGTDLQTVLDEAPEGFRFSQRLGLSAAVQVIDAIQYIHSKGYIHKDIKVKRKQNIRAGNQSHYPKWKTNITRVINLSKNLWQCNF